MSSFSPWLYMLWRYSKFNQRLYTCFTHFHSTQSIQRLHTFIVYIEIHWKWNEMKYIASKMNVNVTQRISGRVPMLNKTRQSIQTLVWPNNFKQSSTPWSITCSFCCWNEQSQQSSFLQEWTPGDNLLLYCHTLVSEVKFSLQSECAIPEVSNSKLHAK